MIIKGQDPKHIVRGKLLLGGRSSVRQSSTTCCRTRPSASSGRRSRRKSKRSNETQGSMGASVPASAHQRRFDAVLMHMISR